MKYYSSIVNEPLDRICDRTRSFIIIFYFTTDKARAGRRLNSYVDTSVLFTMYIRFLLHFPNARTRNSSRSMMRVLLVFSEMDRYLTLWWIWDDFFDFLRNKLAWSRICKSMTGRSLRECLLSCQIHTYWASILLVCIAIIVDCCCLDMSSVCEIRQGSAY